jgi:hypothetical protein
MTYRTASGVKPFTVHLNVGLLPLPEIVTLTGKGTGGDVAAAPSVGVVVVAVSLPFWKVRVHAPFRAELKGIRRAQKLGLTARPTHRLVPAENDP